MKFPNVIGGSYVSQSSIADCERTVNFYVEKMEVPGAKSKFTLYPAPGVKRFGTTFSEQGRALFAQNDYVQAVIGDTLYRIMPDGTTQTLGMVARDDHPATICAGSTLGGQTFITSGGKGYIVDIRNSSFRSVPVPGVASMGAFLDGVFISLDATASHFYLSDLRDSNVWNPTQGAGRQVAPDPWVSMAVNYREIWLFGTETTEVWVNVENFPMPFAPHPSGLIPHGVAAPFSVKSVAGTLCWLSRTKGGSSQVVAAQGYSPVVISTHPVSYAISQYERIDDAIGDTFQMLGHTFYVLTFPTAQRTWVYDFTTQLWTEWLTWLPNLNQYIGWRPLHHAFAYGKHLVLDRDAGNFYETSHLFTTDVDDHMIRRMRVFPGLTDELNRTYYDELVVYLEMGLGLPVGQGSTPQVMLRHSSDGGKTFSNERWCSAGREGQYKRMAQWTRLGSGRDRVFEMTVTDPIPWRVIDAFLTVRKGRH